MEEEAQCATAPAEAASAEQPVRCAARGYVPDMCLTPARGRFGTGCAADAAANGRRGGGRGCGRGAGGREPGGRRGEHTSSGACPLAPCGHARATRPAASPTHSAEAAARAQALKASASAPLMASGSGGGGAGRDDSPGAALHALLLAGSHSGSGLDALASPQDPSKFGQKSQVRLRARALSAARLRVPPLCHRAVQQRLTRSSHTCCARRRRTTHQKARRRPAVGSLRRRWRLVQRRALSSRACRLRWRRRAAARRLRSLTWTSRCWTSTPAACGALSAPLCRLVASPRNPPNIPLFRYLRAGLRRSSERAKCRSRSTCCQSTGSQNTPQA